MNFTIFYSWQMDTPSECNRHFIRKALEEAVVGLKVDGITDSPRCDAGMEGVAGSPEVATMMFKKIETSAIFVGDATLVGSVSPHSGKGEAKRIPNPNVLLEMGYAAGRMGWDRVICVMNEKYGLREDQPFDVRNRRYPINYRLEPGDRAGAEAVKKKLAGELRGAIEAVALNVHETVVEVGRSLNKKCLWFLRFVANESYFSDPAHNFPPYDRLPPEHRNLLEEFPAAIDRLIDLRVLWCDQNPGNGQYAYHWTHLGELLLRHLGMK